MPIPQVTLFPDVAEAARLGGNGSMVGSPEHAAEGTLQELRDMLERLKGDVAEVAARRARAVSQTVATGVEGLQGEIRKAPGTAVVVAVLAGVLIAVAVTSGRPTEPAWRTTARRYGTAMREDLDALLAKSSRVGSEARDAASGLVPTVERLVQSLSQMDVSSQLSPALEKGSSLLRNIWQSVVGAK